MGVWTAEARSRGLRCGVLRHMQPLSAAVPAVSANMRSVWSPLASARSGTARREVMDIQRARIVAAAIDTAEVHGYAGMTVGAIIQRARVSRKTFYDVFPNRHECFTAVIEEIFARAHSVASAAYAQENSWLAATRSALDSLLCLIDAEPGLGRVWFVEALAGPDVVLDYRARAMSMVAEAIDLGRHVAGERRQPPKLAAEAAVGAVSHIIYSRIKNKNREPLAALLGPLMYLIVLPYFGAPRAHAELLRKSVQKSLPQPVARQPREEPLRDMNIRLTYRTIRALGAISERPGASNRMVAGECDIKDQGQISKLLSRLERLGLIENRGPGQDRGGSNAWHITDRGSEIVRATNMHRFLISDGEGPTRPVVQSRRRDVLLDRARL
jgi:AcrR family transcriptional regulator